MGDKPNMLDSSRRWIIKECENSLQRLGTDYIDLYQIHRPSDIVDIDETLGALSDLIHQGKVRTIGHSTFPADYIVEAQWTSEKRGRERFVSEQPPYSIMIRGIERSVLPACEKYGIGVIPWSPLAGGWLGGRYRKGEEVPADSRIGRGWGSRTRPMDDPANQRRLDVVEELVPIADDAGAVAHAHGARVRARAPGRHVGDHRAAHDGAARRTCSRAPTSASTPTRSTRSTKWSDPAPTSRSATRGRRPGLRVAEPPSLRIGPPGGWSMSNVARDRVADELALRNLVARYADAVTRMDAARCGGCSLPTASGSSPATASRVVTTRSLSSSTGCSANWSGIVHALLSGTVTFDATDPFRATGRWYISEFGQLKSGDEVFFAGVYHDEYTRDGGVWRFARRRYDSLFRRAGGAVATSPFPDL